MILRPVFLGIKKELSQSYSDLLFSAKLKGEPVYFYLLIEHQTNTDGSMHVRIFEYMARVARQHFEMHGGTKIPPIFPYLLYAGEKPYTGPICMSDALENLPLWKELFTKKCVADLARDSEEDIYRDHKAALVELVLREKALRKFTDFCDFCDITEKGLLCY